MGIEAFPSGEVTVRISDGLVTRFTSVVNILLEYIATPAALLGEIASLIPVN